MPNNATSVPPTDELTGHSQLPLSRIKKIIGQDSDIAMCSSSATFLISVATEMFIQYMAEQGHNVVKSERKPRKNIQYRDLATAVARLDNLEFLTDVVPRTVTYKQFKEKKARAGATTKANGVESGQTTLDMRVNGASNSNGTSANAESANDDDQDDPSAQLELESRRVRPRVSEGSPADTDGDVDMS